METSQLIKKFPAEWQGMFRVMLKGDSQLLAVTSWLHSEHHSRLSASSEDWTSLVLALCHQEPVSSPQGLVFSSRFQLFPSHLQLQLLTFLYSHREKLTVADLENIVHRSCKTDAISSKYLNDNDMDLEETASNDDVVGEKIQVDDWKRKHESKCGDEMPNKKREDRQTSPDLWVETLLKLMEMYLKERRQLRMSEVVKSQQYYEFSDQMSSKVEDVVQMLKGGCSETASAGNQWQQLTSRWQQHSDGAVTAVLSQPLSQSSRRTHHDDDDDDVVPSPGFRSSPYCGSQGHDASFASPSRFSDDATPVPRKRAKMDFSQMDLSQSDSFGLTQATMKPLEPDVLVSLANLKESWHGISDPAQPPPAEMRLLLECSPHQMEEACQILELDTLSEIAMVTACQHITTLSTELSCSSAELWTKHCILPKVLALTQNSSRVLLGGVIQYSKHFPSQVISELFLPTASSDEFGAQHTDLFSRVIKETFTSDHCCQFLSQLLSTDVRWNTSTIMLIQTTLDTKIELTSDLSNMLVTSLTSGMSYLASDLKFAKFLLAFINKFGNHVSGDGRANLVILVNSNQTFLKKALQSALKKLS